MMADSPSINNRKRIVVALAFAVAIGVELWLLLYDVPVLRAPSGGATGPVEPIAELMSRKNAVRAQAPGDVVWEETKVGQTLFKSQQILTLEKSKAEIAFLDGAGLVLDENSLVMLERNDQGGQERIVVTLVRGRIRKGAGRRAQPKPGAAPAAFEIHVGNAQAKIGPDAELTVAALPESQGGNQILVESGEARVATPSGEAVLRQGEEARVAPADSQERPASHKAAFALFEPAPNELLTAGTNGVAEVKFKWMVDPVQTGGGPLELEVSKSPDFGGDVRRVRIAATTPPLARVQAGMRVPAAASESAWYWRVRAMNDDSKRSPVGRFLVASEAKPKLLYPIPDARVAVGTPVEFSWESEDGAEGYEWTAGKLNSRVSGAFYRVNELDLPLGATSWRVRTLRPGGKAGPWSEARPLQIVDPAPPPPEELHDPEIERAPRGTSWWRRIESFLMPSAWGAPRHRAKKAQSLPHSVKSADSPSAAPKEAFDAESAQYKVKLTWKAVRRVKGYKVQVARERSFTNILSEAEVDDPSYVWDYRVGMENTKGRVFYRVASVSASGRVGRFSAPKPVPIPESIRLAAKAETLAKTDALDPDASEAELEGVEPAEKPEPPKVAVPLEKPVSLPKPHAQPYKATPPVSVTLCCTRNAWKFGASAHTGLGNLSQSSTGAGLSTVTTTGVFVQQKLSVTAELTRETETEAPSARTMHWLGRFELELAGFSRPADARQLQPSFTAYRARIDVLRSWDDWERTPRPWRLAVGADLSRDYLFSKSGPQSLEAKGTYSVGPVLEAARIFSMDVTPRLRPSSVGTRFALPLSGIVHAGHFGAQAGAWGDWMLVRLWRMPLSIRVEADASYLRWVKPFSAGMLGWTAWVAPTLTLGP